MSLLMNSVHYAPVQENISKLVELAEPHGKSVLTVSAYGYALPFFAAGAKNVTSFDISPDQTAWNHFVRSLIMNTSFEYNEEFFYHPFSLDRGQKHIEIPWAKLFTSIPEEYQSLAIKHAHTYLFDSSEMGQIDDIRTIYPQLYEGNFDHMQKSMKHWTILKGEFTDVLEEQKNKFDIINGSTIRGWVYRNGRGTYHFPTPFAKAYDLPLFEEITEKLNPNGKFIESEVHGFTFPDYSFHKKLYQIECHQLDFTNIYVLTKL